jgi:hypothetical protein
MPIDQPPARSGQKTGDAYKVSFPRTDLHLSVHGVAIKPGLALGSWAEFLGTDDNAMVMGVLVLLQDELNPVMAKLRSILRSSLPRTFKIAYDLVLYREFAAIRPPEEVD